MCKLKKMLLNKWKDLNRFLFITETSLFSSLYLVLSFSKLQNEANNLRRVI